MSIVVHKNSDGTFTVTCGDTSVTVGTPTAGTAPAAPSTGSGAVTIPVGGPATYPGVTPVGGGVSISIVGKDPDGSEPADGDVVDIDAILKALQASRAESTRAGLKLRWAGRQPIDIDDVLRKARGTAGPGPLDISIAIDDDPF